MNRTEQTNKFQEALKQLNPSQREAVNTTEGPVMVIAGPGTGKTQVIAARIGNILLTTDAQPSNILCLTYTDAATIAMRSRLIEFIGPTAYNIEIHTFHAFANNVIQDNLYYFGGFRDLQPLTELEEIEIYESIVDSLDNDHQLKRLTGDVYYETRRLKTLFQLMKKENWSADLIIKKTQERLEEMKTDEDFLYKKANNKIGKKKGDLNDKKYKEVSDKFQLLIAAAKLFSEYEKILREKGRYDFQDMILWVLKAFKDNNNLLLDYQERYQYILVDEYQDTNGAQNDLLYMLCDYWENPNVFVVGDDDQSIYRFQGANTQNILEFREKFKNQIKEIVLTDNYRSTQPILDASRSLILKGGGRLETSLKHIDKKLNAARIKLGPKPWIVEYYNDEHELAHIVQQIVESHQQGHDLNKIAVIYRQHKQVEKIVSALEQKGIPLNLKKKFNILDEPWVEQIIDILRFLHLETTKPGSGEYLISRMMYYTYFSIDPQDVAKIANHCAYNAERKSSLSWFSVIADELVLNSLNLKDKQAVLKLGANLNKWIIESQNQTVQVLFEKIINYGGILSSILQIEDKAYKVQVLTTFFDFIKEESRINPRLKLGELLNTLDRMARYNLRIPIQRIVQNDSGVHFITSHSSKGLEFEKVFLLGAVTQQWEGKRNINRTYQLPPSLLDHNDDNKEDEERRLFFVAMTRAEKELHISYADKMASEKPLQESKFVTELEADDVVQNKQMVLSDEDMIKYALNQLEVKPQLNEQLVDQEGAKKALAKFKMSVTALNKYLRCPITFYFENVLRVPTARTVHMGFGQAVHRSLEIFFNEAKRSNSFPTIDELLTIFQESMAIYHSHFTEKEKSDRLAYGLQILPEYYNYYLDQWKKVSDYRMEYNVSEAEYMGVPIKGRLDKVEIVDQGVHVIDFKTGNSQKAKPKLKPPKDESDLGGDYWRQIVYYKILIDRDPKSNWHFISGALDFVQPNDKETFDKFSIQVTADHVEKVGQQIVDAYKKIMNLEFTQGCGEEDCFWCNFVKYNKLESFPTQTEDDDEFSFDTQFKEEISDV